MSEYVRKLTFRFMDEEKLRHYLCSNNDMQCLLFRLRIALTMLIEMNIKSLMLLDLHILGGPN